jgi:protein-S-isoprenylcysteine O-methyltransferase Ste14
MKKSMKLAGNRMVMLVLMMLGSIYSFAQEAANTATESVTSKTTTTTTQEWYTEPWVWIAGGALLFILLLAAILGGGSTNTTTTRVHKTTVTRDDVYDA